MTMKGNDQNLFSVENLLEEAQFSPSPAFREALYNRLKHQLSSPETNHSLDVPQRLGKFHDGRGQLAWRKIFISMAVLCLAFVLLVAFAPGVQAQMISLLQRFGVHLPFVSEGVVISSFTPLAPEEIPAQMNHFITYHQDAGGPVYTELRYFSQDTFIVIYEAPAQPGDVLPQGEPIHIGESDAVMEQDLSGLVFLAAQAPQPWREAGSGGGGGPSDDAADAPPQNLIYSSATRLTWVQSGLYIELLTNLSQDEALSLAASLRPAPKFKKP
jgi:hypothetical protein